MLAATIWFTSLVASAPDGGVAPIILQPLLRLPRPETVARATLPSRDGGNEQRVVIQVNSGGRATGPGTNAIIAVLEPRPRFISLGWAQEFSQRDGRVWGEWLQFVGFDGGECGSENCHPELHLPPGPSATIRWNSGHSDIVFVVRAIAVDLARGTVSQAPWDTRSPASAGAQRFAILQCVRVRPDEVGGAITLCVWKVGSTICRDMVPGLWAYEWSYRATADEVFVEIFKQSYLAVNGTSGRIRQPTATEWEQASPGRGVEPVTLETVDELAAPAVNWTSVDGRPIRIQDRAGALAVPTATVREGDLLFAAEGMFRWPSALRLADDVDGGR